MLSHSYQTYCGKYLGKQDIWGRAIIGPSQTLAILGYRKGIVKRLLFNQDILHRYDMYDIFYLIYINASIMKGSQTGLFVNLWAYGIYVLEYQVYLPQYKVEVNCPMSNVNIQCTFLTVTYLACIF